MPDSARPTRSSTRSLVAAGLLAPWERGELPPPPAWDRRQWLALLGPGVLLAGSAIGAGEWLFGPAVTAQYGGTLLWLASMSIVVQVFCNLEVMRYTLYCGEPIFVGWFRTWPGPRFWTVCYLVLFLAHVWPFMASNAAVPLAASFLGHLPGEASVGIGPWTISEAMLVKLLGYAVFLAAFVPLIFGGKVYNMLERLMAVKLLLVFSFLIFVAVFMVSRRNALEIVTGFFRFGTVPLRAETVVAGPHFTIHARDGDSTYQVKGTVEHNHAVVTRFVVHDGSTAHSYSMGAELPPDRAGWRRRLARRALEVARPGRFLLETSDERHRLTAEGSIEGHWQPELLRVATKGGPLNVYRELADVPEPHAARFRELLANQGLERASLWSYFRRHRKLPPLDWAMLAAFAAIAGAGGLSNSLLSNYTRDKGWGMGGRVGAIPSAVGGRTVALSHVGAVFPLDAASLARWRGWIRHIVRDQCAVWMVCSFIGLALPCMLSLEFIRNAPVGDNRVAAMTAEGIASRYPDYSGLLWSATLLCSFLVLAPNAVISGDLIARMWTDILWVANPASRRWHGHQVKYIYYAILCVYCLWGLVTLWFLNPLQIAKLGAVLGNIALGFSAFHTLHVNRTLLPHELRPNWFMQMGLICCGLFFFAVTALVAL